MFYSASVKTVSQSSWLMLLKYPNSIMLHISVMNNGGTACAFGYVKNWSSVWSRL